MDLGKDNIDVWLEKSKATFIVNQVSTQFYSLYDTLKQELIPIHNDTTSGGIITDIQEQLAASQRDLEKLIADNPGSINSYSELEDKIFKFERMLWLNDHGINHINTVIKRASQLLSGHIDLTPREVYCLLCAIHLHDIGNFYGRIGHEQRIYDVIRPVDNKIGSDHIEKKYIIQIAQVHGGKDPKTQSKDTISSLKKEAPVLDENIRIRLLASILRFADELADDRSRCNEELLLKKKLPKASEVFHAYSYCLSSTIVKHNTNTVELHFDIPKSFLEMKFGKQKEEIDLIDEIQNRAHKMLIEKLYCSRFWKEHIAIENILVIINFYDKDVFGEILPEVTFTLKEKGYPMTTESIFEICPELMMNGVPMNGEYFRNQLKKYEQPV